jgi:hypothetical protein
VKILLRLAILALAGVGAYVLWKRFVAPDAAWDDGPSVQRIRERSELSVDEWAAGSDNPVAQATAILTESDERAELSRDADGIERRRSEDTVEP